MAKARAQQTGNEGRNVGGGERRGMGAGGRGRKTAPKERVMHQGTGPGQQPAMGAYKTQDYAHLFGTPGFSDELLATHFDLYAGYVEHTNQALSLLRDGVDGYREAEVQRRLGWEFNGMRLHELYFGGMANGGADMQEDGAFGAALRSQFGPGEGLWQRFASISQVRGIGWAVLSFDAPAQRFIVSWVDEHDKGVLAGTAPILVMDLFEHAYIQDYGTDRAAYVKAYREAVDWDAVETRWREARHAGRPAGSRPARD